MEWAAGWQRRLGSSTLTAGAGVTLRLPVHTAPVLEAVVEANANLLLHWCSCPVELANDDGKQLLQNLDIRPRGF